MFAPYRIANFRIKGMDVLVNKPKAAAYRAPGAPQALFATESAMDEAAEKLGIDPVELRLRNAVEEGDSAIYGPKFGPIGLRACLEAAAAHPHYTKAKDAGVGRGVAVGFWFNVGLQSSAEVHINEDGTVTVIEGNPDIGGSGQIHGPHGRRGNPWRALRECSRGGRRYGDGGFLQRHRGS